MKGYCFLSAIAMRQEPSDRSEMVNQLLLGNTVEVIERGEKWSLVRADYDGYEGYIDNKQYTLYNSANTLAQTLFLHTPYLWGGRSTMGIDCSGLTQVCFKAIGVWLPRDAYQQATAGHEVCPCDLRPDDLCFFHNDVGKIIHVGIFMGDNKIIHASGEVRIDTLDSRGIYNNQRQEYTHLLHCCRRVY